MKKLKLIAFVAAFTLAANAARAQDDSALLDLLVKKKIITDQEAEQTKSELAQQYASSPAGKLNLSTPIQQIRLYGDARLRYDYREGNTQGASGGSDSSNADQIRYRLRIGADVTLTDDWFLGIRLDTSNNARSTNVTDSQGQTNTAPFGKAGTVTTTYVTGVTVKKNAAGAVTSVTPTTATAVSSVNFGSAIFVGQLYLRYKPFSWLSLEGGVLPNPFIATPMVWDPDINPSGVAEQFKYTFGPFGGGSTTAGYDKDGKESKGVASAFNPSGLTLDVFANFAQLVYDDASPENQFSTATSSPAGRNDTFLLGWQVGSRLNYKGAHIQIAPTFYDYTGEQNSDFGAVYSGDPGGNQTGVNNLAVIDVPVELGWQSWGVPFTVFGDFADNIDANARANEAELTLTQLQQAGTPLVNTNGTPFAAHPGHNDGIAWQAGLRAGQIKKKGDWTLAGYYQYSGAYALDPNLVDNDIFDARLNMKGVVFQAGYALTDAVTLNLQYNYGRRIDQSLGTGGAGGTLGTSTSAAAPILHNYELLQLDINVKF